MKKIVLFTMAVCSQLFVTDCLVAGEPSIFDHFEATLALEQAEVKDVIEQHKDADVDDLVKALSTQGLVSLGGAFVIAQEVARVKELEKEIDLMPLADEEKMRELSNRIDQLGKMRYQRLLEIDVDMLDQEKRDFVKTWIQEYKQHEEEKEKAKLVSRPQEESDEIPVVNVAFEGAVLESAEEDADESLDPVQQQIGVIMQQMMKDPAKIDQDALQASLADVEVQAIIKNHEEDDDEKALVASLLAAGLGAGVIGLIAKKQYDKKKQAGKVDVVKQIQDDHVETKEVVKRAEEKPSDVRRPTVNEEKQQDVLKPDKSVLSQERQKAAAALGLDPNQRLTQDEIKQKFRQEVLADHPDKGGTGQRTAGLKTARDYLLSESRVVQDGERSTINPGASQYMRQKAGVQNQERAQTRESEKGSQAQERRVSVESSRLDALQETLQQKRMSLVNQDVSRRDVKKEKEVTKSVQKVNKTRSIDSLTGRLQNIRARAQQSSVRRLVR